MEGYYSILFLILMCLQEHVKGFLATVLCFIMITVNSYVAFYLESIGYSYYEAYIIYETIVFFFALGLINHRIGLVLCIVSFSSCMINAGGLFMPETRFYQWYSWNYNLVSVFMMEILVWVCITSSKIKPIIVRGNIVVKNQLDKLKCGQ